MKKILILCFIFCLNATVFNFLYAKPLNAANNDSVSIIPQPLSVKTFSGSFTISASTKIYVDSNNAELNGIALMFTEQLKSRTGFKLKITNEPIKKNAIILTTKLAIDSLGNEGYTLSVNPDRVIVRAIHGQGIFYGVQTIYQLMPVNVHLSPKKFSLPAVYIIDKPRFGWRGLMLDAGRYFYSLDFLKKYLDDMAMHKLNVFHWHLTEDGGWRLEIKKYPRLTELGAWREGTQYDKSPGQVDHNPHGGFYTQEQVKELVAYAKKRYIDIIPEIEMPGHSLAALVAYPQLSCTGGPFKVPVQWGIQKDVFCAGNEQTYKFLEDVLTEVAALFPSPYIHIGGDECPKDRWKACPKCQAKIKAEGLKDENGLQSYFIKRIESFLLTKNKKLIGWDEILEGGLSPNATVMSWRGVEGGIAAAKQRHNVIMTPTDYTYFDYYQGDPYLEPVAIGGMLSLEKVYSYEPMPAALSVSETKYIMGIQGNIWSEYIHSPEKVEYMTFPRAAALAEVAWTAKENKNWNGFKKRMTVQYQRYDHRGINYSKSAFNVSITINKDPKSTNVTLITLQTNGYKPDIRYTTDGSEPTGDSFLYDKPFSIKAPGTIKAAVFDKDLKINKVSVCSLVR